MKHARTANLLGALTIALGDRVTETTSESAGHGAAAPSALVTMYQTPGLTIAALARVLGLSHAGTVRLVDRLAADGLVTRRRAGVGAGADGREVALHLEPNGTRTARAVLHARAAVLDAALSTLAARDVALLERVLSRVLTVLSTDPDVADHICRLCDEGACPTATCPVEMAIAPQR